jgi:protein TonB
MRKQTPLRPGLSLSAKRPQSQARSGAVASPLPRIDLKPDQFGTWPLADIILPETPVEQTLLAVSGNQNEFRPEEVQAQPVKLRHVQPEYPRWALQQGLEGTVSLIFLIDETGKTTNIQVTRNSEFPEFDFASIRAVKQWRYKPATREGRPIAVWQPCIVRFQLNE